VRENVEATVAGDGPAATRCHSCGAERQATARFCSSCGAQFSVDGYAAFVDPLVGAVVGERYRIVARIGSGGMGAVYRVEHVQLGKVAAMKLLHGELTRDPQMVRRFSREARAVSRLTSPNTVSVFDFGRSGTFVYIVMELLSGMDLARLLHEQGPLPAWRVASVVRQVAASLAEAHGKGIVHRDLKPQNLFVLDPHGGPDERIKVLDFGLAKAAEGRDDSLELTQAGVVMGTPHYMSPEQIREGDVGADPRGRRRLPVRHLQPGCGGVPPSDGTSALRARHAVGGAPQAHQRATSSAEFVAPGAVAARCGDGEGAGEASRRQIRNDRGVRRSVRGRGGERRRRRPRRH